MSANPCGCGPEAGHECTTHRIQHLEELVQVLQDDLAETRKDRENLAAERDAAVALAETFEESRNKLFLKLSTAEATIQQQAKELADLEATIDRADAHTVGLVAQLDAAEATIQQLQELSYIGDHHFPDLTYKARLDELVPKFRAAEATIASLTAEVGELTADREGLSDA